MVCDAAQPSSVGPGAPPACPCPFYFGLKSQVRMFLSFATVMKSDFSVSVLPAFAEPVSKQRTCCVFVSVVSSFWEEVHTQYRNRKCLRISLSFGPQSLPSRAHHDGAKLIQDSQGFPAGPTPPDLCFISCFLATCIQVFGCLGKPTTMEFFIYHK